MKVPRLTLATANAHKVVELSRLLRDFDVVPRPSDCPEVDETGETFLENARLKAVAVARYVNGLALADDSGLEVEALRGRPGVHSARYAGAGASDAENLQLLLKELAGVEHRQATFQCVLVLADNRGGHVSFSGSVKGLISTDPRGVGGFGYDPVFVPDAKFADGRSFAEMSTDEKAAISHRGEALAKLVDFLGTPQWERALTLS